MRESAELALSWIRCQTFWTALKLRSGATPSCLGWRGAALSLAVTSIFIFLLVLWRRFPVHCIVANDHNWLVSFPGWTECRSDHRHHPGQPPHRTSCSHRSGWSHFLFAHLGQSRQWPGRSRCMALCFLWEEFGTRWKIQQTTFLPQFLFKVLGAHRAGLTTVILPSANARDLESVPDNVKDAITFIPVMFNKK